MHITMNSLRPADAPIDLQKASQMLQECESQQEDIRGTSAHIEDLQKQYDRVKLLEGMKRKERFEKEPELYNEYYQKRCHEGGIKNIEMGILGTFATALFIGAATGGMSGIVFVPLCLTALIAPAVAKSVILSDGRIDTMIKENLKERLEALEQELTSARGHLEEIKSRILEKVAEESKNPDPGANMDDEGDYLIIDGCKLKKKLVGALEFLQAFKKFN